MHIGRRRPRCRCHRNDNTARHGVIVLRPEAMPTRAIMSAVASGESEYLNASINVRPAAAGNSRDFRMKTPV